MKSTRFAFRISNLDRQRIDRLAKILSRSRADVIRQLIQSGIAVLGTESHTPDPDRPVVPLTSELTSLLPAKNQWE